MGECTLTGTVAEAVLTMGGPETYLGQNGGVLILRIYLGTHIVEGCTVRAYGEVRFRDKEVAERAFTELLRTYKYKVVSGDWNSEVFIIEAEKVESAMKVEITNARLHVMKPKMNGKYVRKSTGDNVIYRIGNADHGRPVHIKQV